jgi:hypothetical protein
MDSPSKSRTSYLSKTKLSTANRKPHEKAVSCSINVHAVGLIQYRARHKTKIGNPKRIPAIPLESLLIADAKTKLRLS